MLGKSDYRLAGASLRLHAISPGSVVYLTRNACIVMKATIPNTSSVPNKASLRIPSMNDAAFFTCFTIGFQFSDTCQTAKTTKRIAETL